VASSDILVENFKTGSLEKYGLDAVTLQILNPRLIYCSITGFGQTGPYASLPGYDLLIQAMDGLMSITGVPDGEPGAGPMKVGVALVDILTGLYAANAIQAALLHRQKTGEGQVIDISLLDCLIAGLANQSQSYLSTGHIPSRMGNAHPSIAPYDVYKTCDGHIVLAVGDDTQFRELCTLIGLTHLPVEARFSTNALRVENRIELTKFLHNVLVSASAAHWLKLLNNSNVPVGPVNNLSDVFEDHHVQSRKTQTNLSHATLGMIDGVACPIRLNKTPATYRSAAPVLGQHARDVLESILGYSSAKFDSLHSSRVTK
jgi:crotonobetainyl-CoA:carnitine CoA-transferase CaiB-like acyl-CoA transferase